MLNNILDKIRKPASSSADFRERLAEVERELPPAEARVRNTEQQRASGLLDLDDAALERIEATMRLAIRDRDRLRAAREELERRMVEAEAAEARAVLDGERDAVEARAAKVASRLRREYSEHGAAIVRLLNELAAAEDAVRLVNRKLSEAGRPEDALASVEARAIDPGRNSEHVVSLLAVTALRPLGPCAGWGGAVAVADQLGLAK